MPVVQLLALVDCEEQVNLVLMVQWCNGAMQIRDVQFIVHKDTQRPKGVFVEFATGDELQNALSATGTVRKPLLNALESSF